jgi:putative glutamine amidotransferase
MRIALSVCEKEKAKGRESPYFKALFAVGLRPEEIELVSAADASRVKAEDFDGVLFTGGEDVDPSFYGEKKRYKDVHENPERDRFEFALLDRAMHRHLPILGICRGLQMINVKFEGTLCQDAVNDGATQINHRGSNPRSQPVHNVIVTDPDSQLAQIVPKTCRVNSLHHQAIKRLGRGLKVTAHSEDGLVEAVESADDYPFLMAVQWHPEEMVDDPEHRKIFEQFVAKCREAAARRKGDAG